MCLSCRLALCDVFHTPVPQYSLFVLKTPLNTNQLTNWLYFGQLCCRLLHANLMRQICLLYVCLSVCLSVCMSAEGRRWHTQYLASARWDRGCRRHGHSQRRHVKVSSSSEPQEERQTQTATCRLDKEYVRGRKYARLVLHIIWANVACIFAETG